ncbi:fluoride efflux transporter CrcB [Paenibacillus thailandensis]|jgi:CrcB protein|uniref:Fluoride-specific ion channel FluC n=1 Tax=Paenibacillus thailandensis TaxID=393250 RepID=A0ABW5QYL2_9BACL
MKLAMAVAIGGALGAAARYGTGFAFGPASAGSWPYATLLCNMLGSFLLGLLSGQAAVKPIGAFWKEGIGTGVLGGFTTFSAFSVETVEMLREGHIFSAATYAGFSMAGGILFAAAGMHMTKRRAERKRDV